MRYDANPEKRKTAAKQRKASIAAWLRGYKSERSCVRCGFDNPAALHFHHRDPALKLFNITEGVYQKGYPIRKILPEIGKCDLLCANCHAVEHDSLGVLDRSD